MMESKRRRVLVLLGMALILGIQAYALQEPLFAGLAFVALLAALGIWTEASWFYRLRDARLWTVGLMVLLAIALWQAMPIEGWGLFAVIGGCSSIASTLLYQRARHAGYTPPIEEEAYEESETSELDVAPTDAVDLSRENHRPFWLMRFLRAIAPHSWGAFFGAVACFMVGVAIFYLFAEFAGDAIGLAFAYPEFILAVGIWYHERWLCWIGPLVCYGWLAWLVLVVILEPTMIVVYALVAFLLVIQAGRFRNWFN